MENRTTAEVRVLSLQSVLHHHPSRGVTIGTLINWVLCYYAKT